MYLPLETTFAIFLGGIVKGIVDMVNDRKKHNEGQRARVENTGVLLASGFIAGEALMGLVFALMYFLDISLFAIFENPDFSISIVVLVIIGLVLVLVPIRNAGKPDEPAPPHVSM
jgi:tetrahydromethanopterin S-methyltransferase subunit E